MLIDAHDFKNLLIVGDRVLVKPKDGNDRTRSGLYLPPSVKDKAETKSGYVVKVGPGYPIPAPGEPDEPWKQMSENKQYFPLQAQAGDLAVYLQSTSFELEFKSEKYVIVPHNSILLLVRDDGLFE